MDFFEQMEARIPHGEVRTRFAPSPTGYMHVGNLRTALYTWLIARRHHGKFILRIEDTDQGRLVEGAVDVIYKTMAECGLTHDEGPDVGGPRRPVYPVRAARAVRQVREAAVRKGRRILLLLPERRRGRRRKRDGRNQKARLRLPRSAAGRGKEARGGGRTVRHPPAHPA